MEAQGLCQINTEYPKLLQADRQLFTIGYVRTKDCQIQKKRRSNELQIGRKLARKQYGIKPCRFKSNEYCIFQYCDSATASVV